MSREASRLRAGFFAIPPQALDIALRWLEGQGSEISVLDPCAGEGLALQQIGAHLNVPADRLWAVELDKRRGELCQQNLPGSKVLSPCSYFHTAITPRSFSLVYSNPPFDDAVGGGRMETQFFVAAYQLLTEGGILLGVCPAGIAARYDMRKALYALYDDIHVVPFPERYRKYYEVFVVARKKPLSGQRTAPPNWNDTPKQVRDRYYCLPPAKGPSRFDKTQLTDEEIVEMLDQSPLNTFLEARTARALPRPPLALGVGHLALLLSAGQLDGLVKPPGEPAHLVRGTARKQKELVSEEVTEDKGKTVTKQHFTERIKLVVRCVDASGEIVTLE